VADAVRRIPARAPLALPNAGFPLFAPGHADAESPRAGNTSAETAATAEAVATAEGRAAGSVRARAETVYYEVSGTSEADLAAALRTRGPKVRGRQFFGMTEWEVSAGYRPVTGAGACSIDALTVEVAVTTHLPRWARTPSAPRSLSRAWERFLRALTEHEHGHRALAEEAADAIRHRLATVTASTCERIDGEAQREMAAVMREYEARNRAYDAETGHGRTQGAVW
jgi:predicted secreted Zn-dependent protease